MAINLSIEEKEIWRVVRAVIQLIEGRSNAVGEVTLTPNSTTTVVDKDVDKAAVNVALGSQIFLTPRTANAAGSLLNVWVISVEQGSFVLGHSNLPSVDRTYGFECRGG